MDIVKKTKELGSGIGQGIESGIEKGKKAIVNVASHLPFSNLAKRDSCTFSVEVDLPGVKKEDIELNLDGNKLSVSAVRNTHREAKEEDYYMRESFYGKIARTFVLPDDIDKEKVDAKLEDGRLYITLKKIAAAQPKAINVK
jgi:HSP20 family protein